MFKLIRSLFGKARPQLAQDNSIHPNPQILNLDGEAFQAAYQNDPNAVLLDVRTGIEVEHGKINDAIHIDVLRLGFKKRLASLDKSKTYYVYCRSGGRSDMACAIMHGQGFDVRNLKGGKKNWPQESD